MINSRRAPGPRRAGLAGRRAARRCWPPAPGSWRQHLGPHGRRLRRGRRAAGRRPARAWSRSRSTCRARTSTAGRRPVRPRRPARPPPRSWRPPRRAGGPGGPSSAPTWPTWSTIAARGRARPAPRRSRWSTRCSGMAIDPETRGVPARVGGGGGLSGPAIHPVAVRAVYDVHAALPDLPIVGVGGVAGGVDAVELLLAGASRGAGRARRPSPTRGRRRGCCDELERWCRAPRRRARSTN